MVVTAPQEAVHYPRADAAFQYRLVVSGPCRVRAETLDGAAIGFRHPTQSRPLTGSRRSVTERIRDYFPNAVEIVDDLRPVRPHRAKVRPASALPITGGFAVKKREVPGYLALRDPIDDVPRCIRDLPHFGTFAVVAGGIVDTEKGRALRERRRRTGGIL